MMTPDCFLVSDIGGVQITSPWIGIDPVQKGTFRYEVAGAKISVQKRRVYVNDAYRRTLHKGDRLAVRDSTVSLNDQQIFP